MMLLRPGRRAVLLAGILPFNPFAQGGPDNPTSEEEAYKERLSPEVNRIRQIFIVGEDGSLTKELRSIISLTTCGFVAAGLYGSIMHAREAEYDFKQTNQLTRFYSHYDAARQLNNHMTRRFMINFVCTGGKVGVFCFLYGTFTAFAAAYKARHEVSNYVIGGAMTGCLFKMNMGIKGMLAGTVVGMGLGGLSGCMGLGMLKLTGLTMEDIQEKQALWIERRNKYVIEMEKRRALEPEQLSETQKMFVEARLLEEALEKEMKEKAEKKAEEKVEEKVEGKAEEKVEQRKT